MKIYMVSLFHRATINKLNPGSVASPTTSGLETEWNYSGRKGRAGQKKKIGKVNEKRKNKKSKKEQNIRKWMDKGKKGGNGSAPGPGGASTFTHQTLLIIMKEQYQGYGLAKNSPICIRCSHYIWCIVMPHQWITLTINKLQMMPFCQFFTGSIARSANLPVFSLLRGRFWGFSPRSGDTLHRWGWNLAWMPNFTPIGATTRV